MILFAAPPHVIDLPDDDEDVPLRSQGRRNRKASAGKTPQSASATETAIQEGGNANRTSVTFAVPLTSAQPSTSTAQTPVDPSSLFTAHHIPEDQVGAAKEAYARRALLGDVVISKKFLRTHRIMVMHSNERGECVHVPS